MITLVTVLVGALAAAAGAGAATIHWKPCTQKGLKQMHAQCGVLAVPLDYNDPGGAQIHLAVSRVLHTSSAANYHGVILTNPGGPGGSGYTLSAALRKQLIHEHYAAAAADYDWIGFDPRGVGRSRPRISCEPNFFHGDRPSYVPTTPKLMAYWRKAEAGYAKACGDRSAAQSALLRNMTTVDNAEDMDSIREALGAPAISYLGYSWGTQLGQTYATLYPAQTSRLILDSNVNPRLDDYQTANLYQDKPFVRNANIWYGWLARHDKVFHLGSTESAVRALYNRTLDRLAKHPIDGVVGPDEWTDIFTQAGYYQATWVELGEVFSAWVHHPSARVARVVAQVFRETDTPGDDNVNAVYLAVSCTDSHWPTNWHTWDHDTTLIAGRTPFFAWGNTWLNAPCINWPAPSQNQFQINGSQVGGALLIDETLDAATPFPGSVATRALFPHSVLLAEPGGTTHAGSLRGDKCVDGTIAAYLASGRLPARRTRGPIDKRCAPLPQPVPLLPKQKMTIRTAAARLRATAARLG